VIPSDMGNTCPLQSFISNSTFIMLDLVHEMDIDYLLVDKMINVSILFDDTCMFSIGCKPNEDINTSAIIIPSVEILGPITPS
jgi:hypothetical protein